MVGVEKEVSELCEKSDLIRRAFYNCLAAANRDKNDILAEAHFNEARGLVRQLTTMIEDTRRRRDQLRGGEAPPKPQTST